VEQYRRIISAIEYTLDQLRRGPKSREDSEAAEVYAHRVETWYECKSRFCLYAIKCLKTFDLPRAEGYLLDLRTLGDDI
jgi:hypothetical protein